MALQTHPPVFTWGEDCGQHCGTRRRDRLIHCPTCHQIAHARRLDDQHNAAPPPVDARPAGALETQVDLVEERDPRLVKRT